MMPGYSWQRHGKLTPAQRQEIIDSVPGLSAKLADLSSRWAAGEPSASLESLEEEIAGSVEGAAVSLGLAQPVQGGGGPLGITGTPTVGSTLAVSGAPAGSTFQWTRDGLSINNETNSTYVVKPGDAGHLLNCNVLSKASTDIAIPAATSGVRALVDDFEAYTLNSPPTSPWGSFYSGSGAVPEMTAQTGFGSSAALVKPSGSQWASAALWGNSKPKGQRWEFTLVGDAAATWYAYLRLHGANQGNGSAYGFGWKNDTTQWRVVNLNNGAYADVMNLVGSAPAAGDRIAIEANGTTLRFLIDRGNTGTWAEIWKATDATYRDEAGTFAFEANGILGIDDLYFVDLNASVSTPNVLWFKANEGSGTLVTDSSGRGFDGTLAGGAWVTDQGHDGLSFNGSAQQYIQFGPVQLSPPNSVAFWIKWLDADDAVIIGGAQGNYALYADQDQIYYSAGSSNFTSEAHGSLLDGNWHHYAVTNDGAHVQFYLDGLAIGGPHTLAHPDWNMTVSRVAMYDETTNNHPFHGMVDDIRMYGFALSSADVATLYATPHA